MKDGVMPLDAHDVDREALALSGSAYIHFNYKISNGRSSEGGLTTRVISRKQIVKEWQIKKRTPVQVSYVWKDREKGHR